MLFATKRHGVTLVRGRLAPCGRQLSLASDGNIPTQPQLIREFDCATEQQG